MTIDVRLTQPLVVTVDEEQAAAIETLDAGAVLTAYLHQQAGEFEERPLGEFVDVVSASVNPQGAAYQETVFEYVDLREIDDIYGQVLTFRIAQGREIGSTKHRFRRGDILFAKIMPSLANKKIALVTQDVSNAVASTEFVVLRKKADAVINLYYLFRALRSDHFTRQAVANVTGATGRQRVDPRSLLQYRIIYPPPEVQERIGDVVEQEFTLRTLAAEQSKQADDEAAVVLGPISLRTERPASRAASRLRS
jgi:Type I restriction modification DNA specificity domain